MREPWHISSLLITADPSQLDHVEARVLAMDGTEVAARDQGGKLIVTLESSCESEIVSALVEIQLLDGVVAAALVFHQTDTADLDATL